MAARPALTDPERPTLVGLRPVVQGERIRAGVHLSERVGLGLATVASHKGQGEGLKQKVREVYGVDLPDRSIIVREPAVSFVGIGPGQWLAVSAARAPATPSPRAFPSTSIHAPSRKTARRPASSR